MADAGFLDFKDEERQQELRNLLLADLTETEIEEKVKELMRSEKLENVATFANEENLKITTRNNPELVAQKNKIQEKARIARMHLKGCIPNETTTFVTNITSENNINSLSNEEAITLWEIIKSNPINVDELVQKYLNGETKEVEASIFGEITEKKENDAKKIAKETTKFAVDTSRLEIAIGQVETKLIEEGLTEEITENLKQIYLDNETLTKNANLIKDNIAAFKKKYNDSSFTGTEAEIKKEVNNLHNAIRELKQQQINLYNSNVEKYNELLKLTKEKNLDNVEIKKLSEMAKVEINIKNYTQSNYLSQIKIKELIDNYKKIAKFIDKKENIHSDTNEEEKESIPSSVDKNELNKDDSNYSMSYYNQLMNEIDNSIEKANFIDMCVNYLYSDATYKDKTLFDNEKIKLQDKYKSLKEKITASKENGSITDIELENLNKRLNDLENIIEHIKNIEVTKTFNWTCIDNSLNSVEEAISNMAEALNECDKIKGNENRKAFDNEFIKINKKLKSLKEIAEKETDPIKKEKLKKKINTNRHKLHDLRTIYLKKCPLVVRTIRKAKKFYKKHPKLVLLGTGLAITAITHATVGPIIIPAIMKGNSIIMTKLPITSPIFQTINRNLGKIINAKLGLDNKWYLANGAKLTVKNSSTLLKGLAYSLGGVSIGTAITANIVKNATTAIKEIKGKIDKAFGKGTFDAEEPIEEIVAEEVKLHEDKEEPIEEIVAEEVKLHEDKLKIEEILDEIKITGLSVEEYLNEHPENEKYAYELLTEFNKRGEKHGR